MYAGLAIMFVIPALLVMQARRKYKERCGQETEPEPQSSEEGIVVQKPSSERKQRFGSSMGSDRLSFLETSAEPLLEGSSAEKSGTPAEDLTALPRKVLASPFQHSGWIWGIVIVACVCVIYNTVHWGIKLGKALE